MKTWIFIITAAAFTLSTKGAKPDLSYAINLNGYHDLTISGKVINGGVVPAITLTNCHNIHITKNRLGNSADAGIYLYNCYNITIDYNRIANVSTGVYVVNTSRGGISVTHNQFRNMHGPMPRGQFVQFNAVSGPYNTISYNRGENIPGASNPEDAINLYKSSGTPGSPIKIIGNQIRGGGPSKSGGGIMLGDNGGGYQVASENILVDPGQYGIAVAGGDHIALISNTVYGRAQYFTNVGIYVWGQGGYHCSNITVSGNRVKFMNAKNVENDSWIGTGETKPAGWDSNEWGAQLSPEILPRAVVSF
jgi:parallel beta-helix repeat protein